MATEHRTGEAGKPAVQTAPALPDFEALSQNLGRLVDEVGRAASAYLRPLEERRANTGLSDEVTEVAKTLGIVAERWLSDPQKAAEVQGRLGTEFVTLWASTLKRMQGAEAEPVARPEPRP